MTFAENYNAHLFSEVTKSLFKGQTKCLRDVVNDFHFQFYLTGSGVGVLRD